ncbi:MAG: tRNA1(Val) (adenine(37)-N6)-methyltransferase [Thermodesulfobacteriota bacterium]
MAAGGQPPAESRDHLFGGRLVCRQGRHGYRFSVDAVLLAHFSAPAAAARVLDMGAGCGIVSLLLAYRHPSVTITAVELQADLARLIRVNAEENGFADRLRVVEGDLAAIGDRLAAESFDWAVANPPFYRDGSGRVNPGSEQALARHELPATLPVFVGAMAHCLKNRGRGALIYPAARLATLITELKARRLEPKRLQLVHSRPGEKARLVLVEVLKNGGEGLEVLPPFFIYDGEGKGYSAAMAACYRG